MEQLARILGALVLLALAAFCGVGFLATFEYADPARRLPWQRAYGTIVVGCLLGVAALFLVRRRGASDRTRQRARARG